MRLFLSGGGAGKQNELALQRLNEIIEHDKKVLYIPLAMKPEKYDKCYFIYYFKNYNLGSRILISSSNMMICMGILKI